MVTVTFPDKNEGAPTGGASRKWAPAAYFGMPLGIVALGLAWRSAAVIWAIPTWIAETLVWGGAALWLLLFVLYLGKWIWRRPEAKAEFEHPVQCCFVGLVGVVALLISIGLATEFRAASIGFFVLGLAWVLIFAVYRTGLLWMGNRSPDSTTPVLYLPTVAGLLVTASAAAALGHRDWGQIAFGGGLFSWLAIESVLIHRLYTAAPLPAQLRPTLGIQIAPASVAAVAYLNIGGAPELVAHALLGYALLQALIVVRLLPWIREAGLTPAWWSFSFAAAALPTAVMKMIAAGDTGAAATLAPFLFAAGNFCVAAILVMTVSLVMKGRLLPS